MKVRSPDGQVWRVTRRWVPWRRRLKGAANGAWDVVPSGLGDDPISVVILVLCLVVAIPFLLLALVAGVELLAVLVVFPFALVGRMVFGQRWTIEARRGFRIWWEGEGGDWQASGVRIHEVAAGIERGELPPQNVDPPEPAVPEPAREEA